MLSTYLYGSTPSRACETVGGDASANPRPSNAECTEKILFAVSCIDSKSSSTSSAGSIIDQITKRNYILFFIIEIINSRLFEVSFRKRFNQKHRYTLYVKIF